ncbi:hypothetical protein EVG20_g6222 [Dentipellis fragilis]|uniref:Matrin-type domain-containing protein n=1 Tax=Dentipellis fragilis TaxID=205917 RepID=A0A4Y9YNF7_9AGAM|nr:hypothetical protein EVG20_g6222 [Dentipellis fragilis]
MSEYWVSKKRYFCQYCEIYIADDAPSRQHHENGMRHRGNKERFVRSLYKAGEKRKKDAEEEKREMIRIEQAAQAAFSQDVGAGHASASSSSVLASATAAAAAAASSSKKPPPRPTDKFANYSTAQSLGYTDPDLERAQAEAERRQRQGVAGEWQYVQNTPPPASGSREASVADAPDDTKAGAGATAITEDRKRPADTIDGDDESGRGWKLRKKTAAVGLGELYDPGLIPIKVKPKKEEVKEEVSQPQSSGVIGADASRLAAGAGPATEGPAPSSVPKWTATKWRKAGEEVDSASATPPPGQDKDDSTASNATPGVNVDTDNVKEASTETIDSQKESVKLEESAPVKLEPPVESQLENTYGGSLFRRRRLPASGGSAGRGRRF